ncbi:epimerase [Deltaproteobacteria bacterium Smac51]|nr:epimerase [Deltaproteobacteria bacterium Smac51]
MSAFPPSQTRNPAEDNASLSAGGKHILTGAFGYSGSYLAALLFASGADQVHTLVNNTSVNIPPELENIHIHPLDFENISALVKAMEGADVFYNTYWVRFNHKDFNHAQAVKNTRILFEAAKMAGVRKVVHISITNPSLKSPYEYFRGKAILEEDLKNSGLAYSILRPAVLFGGQDILVNNIAWALRTFPIFGVFGQGNYGIRPIYVRDLARLMLINGQKPGSNTINAVGPERYTYRGLCEMLVKTLGLKRIIFPCPAPLAYALAKAIGIMQGDVFLTWPEIKALMDGLLDTPESPYQATGRTLLSTWAERRKDTLGRQYASELARRRGPAE